MDLQILENIIGFAMHSADPVRPLDDTGDTAMACFESLERSALDFGDWTSISA